MNKEERTAWLKERRKGIGGSDIPIIFGISQYKTPFELWQEKTDRISIESEDTPDIKRGRSMEHMIAEMYTQITSRTTVKYKNIQHHPVKLYLAGNPDRKIYDSHRLGFGILEIKAPSLGPFGKMVRTNSPRFQDVLQLHHYMLVTGADWGAIACHNSERWKLIHWDIERDEELINQIIEECEAFWHCVETDTPPEEKEIKIKIPEATGDALVKNFDDESWKSIADNYKETKELEQEVKEMAEKAKREIKAYMGDYMAGEGHGIRVYNTRVAGRKSLDKKALAKAYPKIDFSQFEKTGKSFEQLKVYILRGTDE